jgi:hypothetical protein
VFFAEVFELGFIKAILSDEGADLFRANIVGHHYVTSTFGIQVRGVFGAVSRANKYSIGVMGIKPVCQEFVGFTVANSRDY